MIDNSILYSNPIITPGFYIAQITDIEAENGPYKFPKVLVTLKIRQGNKSAVNKVLTSIIHSTEKSAGLFKKFCETFLQRDDKINGKVEIKRAIGRYGSIGVYTSEYQEHTFSAVTYVEQTPITKKKIEQLCAEDVKETDDDESFPDVL